MNRTISFRIRQYIKMFLQHVLLPGIYRLGCLMYRDVDQNLVVFADAHHTKLPFSMQEMYKAASERKYRAELHLYDYSHEGEWKSLLHSCSFMLLYAQAKYVFICDNFLPVASCNKRKDTQVIQLWHSCGLMKKMGYDTDGDIPPYYKGNVYRNYDLVTVSAPCCVPFLTSGMRQKEGVVKALGVSRTDVWFSEEWLNACKDEFYRRFPNAVGKKILLWAPTFRGNAANPELTGEDAIDQLEEALGAEWCVIRKVHPHLEVRQYKNADRKPTFYDIPTERILPVADLLITDYSSVLFDYLFLQKPFVLFAPDRKIYEKERGLYVEYRSFSPWVAETVDQLLSIVPHTWENRNCRKAKDMLKKLQDYHNASCDGQVTERILNYLEGRK